MVVIFRNMRAKALRDNSVIRVSLCCHKQPCHCLPIMYFTLLISKCEKESINKLSLNGTWRFHFESSTINSPKSTSLHLPAEGWFSPPASILICDLTCHYIDSCPRWSTFVLSNKASDKSKRLRKRPRGTTIPMYSSEKSYALKVGAAATAI